MKMVYDRTQNDVDEAIRIRAEKLQKFFTLTEEEIEILEKGTITANTLNRIERQQNELKTILNSMGYWNTPIENKFWDYTDIFDESNFKRILENIDVLRRAFFEYSSTPATPPVSYYYADINSIEKILSDLQEMAEEIKSFYKESGDFECGEQ